jgi:hypothetical protein
MTKETYGYKEFIEAFILKERYKDAAPELRDYHAGLYDHLRDFFGADLDRLVSTKDWTRERHGLDLLFRRTLEGYLGISSPFGGFLEAPREICDLYESYGGRIDVAVDSYQEACLDLMCEIYRLIFGATDKHITSVELRKLGFDDSEEPDELDFI